MSLIAELIKFGVYPVGKLSQARNTALATFTNTSDLVSATFGYYTSALTSSELVLQSNNSGVGTLVLQNLNSAGYSSVAMRDENGREKVAFGFGNSASPSPIFVGRPYLETWNTNIAGALPPQFVFCCDGQYGRTGSANSARFFQRSTFDHLGFQFWKGVPWSNGTEQVKTAHFHEGGFFAIANTAVPHAIDINNGECAYWFDATAGTPALKLLARDAVGSLFSGTATSLTAATATVADAFTAADSASSITAGRTPDIGSAWAAADSDNWGISSNQAYRSNGTVDSYAYIDSGLADVSVEAAITLSSVRASAGFVIRGVDASNYTVVLLKKSGASNALSCFNCGAGAFTELTPFGGLITAAALALNTTYKVRAGAVGNSIFLYIDGVYRARWEDSTHVAATRQGLWSYIGVADDDGGTRWDNFKVYA